MEDVIFAGTRERKPLSMATVTMTLVADERQPAHADVAHVNGLDAGAQTAGLKTAEASGEITVTRRLYRSGESEYLINGKLARLRDIQDIFLGTGLGPESYAIIEQGRIGQILSTRAQERRGVIEEAAGITKFKTRRRLAEARLEGAKQNLARVYDILEEVTRQANSLKRQAAKTKRYTELKAEAATHLRQLLAAKFAVAERENAKTAIELNLAIAELQKLQTEISDRETEQAGIVEALYATERELTEARKNLADLQLEAERVRGRLEYQTKQIEQIQERLEASEAESEVLGGEENGKRAELERVGSELAALESEFETAQNALEVKAGERQQTQTKTTEQEHELERTRQNLLAVLGESSALRNRITQADTQLESIERHSVGIKTEEEQSSADFSRLGDLKARISEDLSARQMELSSLTEQRKSIEQELAAKRAALADAQQAIDRLRVEFSRVRARRHSIEEVLQHRSYTTESVKRFFTDQESGAARTFTPLGVLADFLEAEPKLEKAIEEFLHDELEYVVVEDWAQAERGIELTRAQSNGRATFLVNGGDSGVSSADADMPAVEPGAVTKLTDALRVTNSAWKTPWHLLARIERCYIAADRSLAQDLAVKYPHCWFLTPDGVSYHGLAVSGGKKTGAGPLALKRELRETVKLQDAKERELTAMEKDANNLHGAISVLAETLEGVRAGQQTKEKEVLTMDHESRKLAEDFQRVQSKLSHARIELDRISHERAALEESLSHDHAALDEKERVKVDQEHAVDAAREKLTELKRTFAHIAEEHATLRAAVASLEERRRALAESRSRVEVQAEELANRRTQIAQQVERLVAEREQLLASNAEIEQKRAELESLIAAAEATGKEFAARELALRDRLIHTEEELKRLRAHAQDVQERRSDLQVMLARAESEIAHLQETCQRELQSNLADLAGAVEAIPDETALADIEGRYAEVNRRIEALGPVNPEALEEFEEARQREEFLAAQRQDLLDSIRDTEHAIQAIDSESRKRFSDAFQAINANFRETFATLFSGGIGEMRLTEEDNPAESGVEIVASPPGKKLQSVLLLSGGEKSLTAMALLMAIFQYTPSPFCILDEVDAPLDEPNIERLTRLLKRMAEQTQFIIITHAKRTMEIANTLYGVTMQEPGISKLVSVKFKPTPEPGGNKARLDLAHEEELESVIA